jgi:hypothetical protein
VLGQPVLEDFRQQDLGRDFVIAHGTGVQVNADVLLKLC